MAIKLDEARVRFLKITDTGGNRHISFSRSSYNYIAAPSAGTIGLIANDTLSAAGCAMVIGTSSAYPGTTNTVSLGTSSYKWANVYATTFTGNVTGNLTGDVTGTASKATTITITNTDVSSWYPITFASSTGTGQTLRSTDGLAVYPSADPAADTEAWTYLRLGNTSATSTAGNKSGRIRMYRSSYYADIYLASLAANRSIIFRDYKATGYLVATTTTDAVGSTSLPVYVNANGVATAVSSNSVIVNLASTSGASIYAAAPRPGVTGTLPVANGGTGTAAQNANRLVWTYSATEVKGGYHYANSTKVAINYSSEPSYNFYVSGTSYFSSTALFDTPPVIRHSGSRYGYIYFQNDAGLQMGAIGHDVGNSTTVQQSRFFFREWSANATNDTGRTEFYETYYLPASTDGLTENKTYSILTTKNTVTLAQGGTGATSRSGAWTNIVAAGGTFTGSITISHATSATMDSTTTNPRIMFSESGSQTVGIVYTDYDSYRSPAGLKVMDMTGSNGNVWFEVTGEIIAGTKVTAPSFAGALTGNATTATTLANSRSLKISSTPGTTGTSFNGSADVTLVIPATVKTFTELGTNKISSTAALYITPASTLYLDSAASTSILFRPQGTEKARFNASGDFLIKTAMYPGTNNTYNLGTSSSKWANVYATTFNGALSGNATTASAWATARTLTLAGDLAGSVSVKGNADMTLTATAYSCSVSSSNTSSYPYHRIAYITGKSSNYSDTDCILDIRKNYDNASFGRIKISFRTNASGAAVSCNARWIYRSGFAVDDVTVAWWGVTGNACYADVFLKVGTYARTTVYQQYGSRSWTLVSSSEGSSGANPTEAYVTVADAGTALHSQAYTSTAAATDTGIVNYANSAGTASTCTGNSATATKLKLASTGISSTTTTNGLLEAGFRLDTVAAAGTSINNDGIVATFGYSSSWGAQLFLDDGSSAASMYVRNRASTSAWNDWRRVWLSGDSVTGAVWNDYAEYRESDCKEFGRVLAEKGDDTLTKTTKRLQPFAGVSSDTWGFCQGETEKAKTPIAVAGRVLVYTYRNRKEYKPGDVVCAAPNGTVDIMTREEIIKYPDRIVGTVSCVPEYETWGSGDRDPVKVGNRIWIKVK